MTVTQFRNAYLDGMHAGSLAAIARRAASDHADYSTAESVNTLHDSMQAASLDAYDDAEFAVYASGYTKGLRALDRRMRVGEIAGSLLGTLWSLQTDLETQLAAAA